MRLLLALAVTTAVLLGAQAANAPPARCAFCVTDECHTSGICGHGCFCLKQGDDIMGLCYSSG